MDDALLKISLGNGLYKYVPLDNIFDESDSGDEAEFDEYVPFSDLIESEPVIMDNVVPSNIVNDKIQVTEEELDSMLDEFEEYDKVLATPGPSSDPDLVPVKRTRNSTRVFQKERSLSPKPVVEKPKQGCKSKVSQTKSAAAKSKAIKHKFRRVKWRKGSFINHVLDDYSFRNKLLTWPEDIGNLISPYDFFRFFFTDELLDHIVEESKLYAVQQHKTCDINRNLLLKYLGILVLHSTAPCRNFRYHWNANIGNPVIKETLNINQFEKIREFLHFNDNSRQKKYGEDGFDKLFKIRPVIKILQQRFRSLPKDENVSVDEQMCPTKARHHLRQYMPDKPKKHGFKIFVLCSDSGIGYDFEIYCGTEAAMLDNENDISASSNVVLRLSRSIPVHVNHKLFCDNYYTGMPLFACLYEKGILALGTIRRNRIVNCPLKIVDKQKKKEDRGTMLEYISSYKSCPFICTEWKDNKHVVLLSTFVGKEPQGTVQRYNRSTKQYDTIHIPQVIRQYNRHMGGVDLLDSDIAKSRIIMRSRKWYMRIFHHLLDFSICNARFLHNKVVDTEKTMLDFRIELGTTLCKIGKSSSIKRIGRPNNMSNLETARKKKLPIAAPIVSNDVRYDSVEHWPEHGPKRLCKYENCIKKKVRCRTRIYCTKCKVALCMNLENNCFTKYHIPKK